MIPVAQLGIEMVANVARLAKDMDAVRRKVDTTFGSISNAAGVLKNTLGGLFVGLSVGGLVQLAKSGIDAIDALNDVADATGATVENISALQNVARLTGTDVDVVTGALVKFNGVLKDADPTKGPGQIIEALGLSLDFLKRQDPAEALRLVTVALEGVEDQGTRARVVQELFGKSVKEVAPFLKDLAAAGQLNATVTTEQAAQAELLNKEMFKLQTFATNTGNAVLFTLVPALNQLIEKFREGQKEGRGFFDIALSNYADNVRRFYGIQKEANETTAEAARLARSGTGGSADDQSSAEGARLARVRRERELARQNVATDPKASGATASAAAAQAAAAQRAQAEALQKIISLADYRNKQFDEELQKEEAARLAVEDRIRSAREMAEAIERDTALIGLNSNQRELAVALMDLERQGITQGTEAYALRDRVVSAITAKQAKEAALAEQQTQAAAAKAQDDANKQRTAALADSIEQGILTGFRGGMSVADVFLNELKAQFAKTVLRPVIEPIAAAGSAFLSTAVTSLLSGKFPTFAGGGYTGSGARAGGMDGQGGYLAMLHPRETVVDHTKGQGAAPVSIVIHNTIGDVASQSNVVSGMQQVRQQIMGELARSRTYGGAAA